MALSFSNIARKLNSDGREAERRLSDERARTRGDGYLIVVFQGLGADQEPDGVRLCSLRSEGTSLRAERGRTDVRLRAAPRALPPPAGPRGARQAVAAATRTRCKTPAAFARRAAITPLLTRLRKQRWAGTKIQHERWQVC